jgi:hypothetical protein
LVLCPFRHSFVVILVSDHRIKRDPSAAARGFSSLLPVAYDPSSD